MIHVTKTFLPDIAEYINHLEEAWDSAWLTNRGQLSLRLEDQLRELLEVDNILLINNGTIALQIALKILGKGGEIITTPFSYVATTSSIVWENCTPVFVDIDPVYFTIDERLIENAISEKTTAILATHVFGNPCNVDVIDKIAKKHGIMVIYDAAHCFGVKYKGDSIFNFGDVSTCSFHATKLFHTGEGGAVFSKNTDLFNKLYYSHNFGHKGTEQFHGLGVNGKISELQAALGLTMLPHMSKIIQERKKVVEYYRANLNGAKLKYINIRDNVKWNYSYFPVVFQDEAKLLAIKNNLEKRDIVPRRYFYPSLNTLPYVDYVRMENSEYLAKRILCLPLYVGLEENHLETICGIINEGL